MKKLLYSLAILFTVVGMSLSQVPLGYTPVFNLFTTNVLMSDATHSNLLNPGAIAIHGRAQAIIGMHSYPSGGAYGRQDGELSLYYDNGLGNGGFFFDTNVFVTGDVIVSGNVSAATNILWQTNVVFATNAINATNDQWGNVLLGTNGIYADTNLYKLAQSYYPTNESVNVGGTNVITDMAIPYADVNWVTNMYMGRCTNLSDTKYQTAVRMIHGGPATGANIGFDSTLTRVGTWRFTNYAVITFFWNPATSVTNALCVPMY